VKIVLLVVNSEKNDQVVTETVLMNDEITTPVEEMMVNEAIGYVPHVETITLLSGQNATAVESQRKATFRNVAVHSETIEAAAEMIMVEEVVTTEEAEIKNNIIEMTGFVLHVRMTISHSELNAINVVNHDLEDNQVGATEEVATETTVAETVADVTAETEEVDSAADATAEIVADVTAETEEVDSAADATVADVTAEIVADVVETEEVDSAADATAEIVADVVETEEVDSAADVTAEIVADVTAETVADVVETETVVEEMIAQTNNTERLVESDLVMLTIAHLRKYSLEDISDAMTMTIKVKS
jgi:hypothetical protein